MATQTTQKAPLRLERYVPEPLRNLEDPQTAIPAMEKGKQAPEGHPNTCFAPRFERCWRKPPGA